MKGENSTFTKFNIVIISILAIVFAMQVIAQKSERQNEIGFKDVGIDESFSSALNSGYIFAADIQSDGKIIAAGDFSLQNETFEGIKTRVIRLNSDGSLDKTFKIYRFPSQEIITQIKIQPDGKILIAYNGILMRLNNDGALDEKFTQTFYFSGLGVKDIQLYPDGKILVSGNFIGTGNFDTRHVARLNQDGTVDQGFCKMDALEINKSAISADGKIYIGNDRSDWDTGLFPRLNPDGSKDFSFFWSRPLNYRYEDSLEHSSIYDVVLEKNGNLLISGFISNNNRFFKEEINGIYRMTPEGRIITKFDGIDNKYNKIYPQNDGKVLILSGSEIRRYLENGQIDPTFNKTFSVWYNQLPLWMGVLTQPDGKILFWGSIEHVNGFPIRKGIVRFNKDN